VTIKEGNHLHIGSSGIIEEFLAGWVEESICLWMDVRGEKTWGKKKVVGLGKLWEKRESAGG